MKYQKPTEKKEVRKAGIEIRQHDFCQCSYFQALNLIVLQLGITPHLLTMSYGNKKQRLGALPLSAYHVLQHSSFDNTSQHTPGNSGEYSLPLYSSVLFQNYWAVSPLVTPTIASEQMPKMSAPKRPSTSTKSVDGSDSIPNTPTIIKKRVKKMPSNQHIDDVKGKSDSVVKDAFSL